MPRRHERAGGIVEERDQLHVLRRRSRLEGVLEHDRHVVSGGIVLLARVPG
jgi:hypothetical protein